MLIDPFWDKTVINPSRCALLCSDQWGTVSKSYREDLLKNSPLASLLRKFNNPFAFPNGIFRHKREEVLKQKIGLNHTEAKRKIQMKYFGLDDLDDSIPLFSFVGRITEQKGVSLICQTAEMIINKCKGKIQILVGGMGNLKDPYVSYCVSIINHLKGKFPNCFWANPSEFFTDGPLINIGSDFGLMPSVFEPGGIVQHEFFIASTPVLAFKTGGLKDTVIDYNYDKTNEGNGITFENHCTFDLLNAFERALKLYDSKNDYLIARENAYKSAIDVIDVAKAWDKEFHRIHNKVYINSEMESKEHLDLDKKKKINNIVNNFKFDNFCFEDRELHFSKKESFNINNNNSIKVSFSYPDKGHLYKSVCIKGNFDGWTEKIDLNYNPIYESWSTIVKLPHGVYLYKYLVDDKWQVNYLEKTQKDENGNDNNFINI